jgi:hypothetical protein
MPELTGQSLMFGHHEAQASCDVNRFVSGSMFSLGSDSLGHGCDMAHGCDASTVPLIEMVNSFTRQIMKTSLFHGEQDWCC